MISSFHLPAVDPVHLRQSSCLNFFFHGAVHHNVNSLTISIKIKWEGFAMLMADTMAIFFVILGLLLAFPGLWVLCRGLWPRAVAKAAAVCGKGLIKPFLAGLPLTAVMIFAAAALGNFGPAGKIAAVATICLYLMIANCGVAGLVTAVGERLAGPSGNIDSEQPWRATLRGGVALGLASLLPVLGWFVILPAAMIIGCGANLLSLLRALAASRVRSGQALASPVETSELGAAATFGAEQ